MLPIFRTISVGGVLLAITILALALRPPSGLQQQFAQVRSPAHGALIDRAEHPEWRQVLIRAAVRRADELGRLRELPDTPVKLPPIPEVTPVQSPSDQLMIAGLPAGRANTDPDDDETGSIDASPGATIPIEIGETSSLELPVTPVEERPPVITMRERVEAPAPGKPVIDSRRKPVQRRAAKPAARNEAPVPFNFLQAFFDSFLPNKPAAARLSQREAH
jgi:hypothetical protein